MDRVVHIDRAKVDLQQKELTASSTVVTYNEHSTSYAKQGWDNIGASITTPWLSAEFSYGTEKEEKDTKAGTSLWVTGHSYWLMARLTLDATGLVPDPGFDKAVRAAVEVEDLAQRIHRLKQVFAKWGYWYLRSVDMGAARTLSVHETTTEAVSFRTRSIVIAALI